jgi:hypothetical protein
VRRTGEDNGMSNPQQPELRRNGLTEAVQGSQKTRVNAKDNAADEGGSTAPTPDANATEDARRSGSKSMTRDALGA